MFGSCRLGAQRGLLSLVGQQVVNVGTAGGLSCVRNTADGFQWWEPDIRVAAGKRGPLLRIREDPQAVCDRHCSPLLLLHMVILILSCVRSYSSL